MPKNDIKDFDATAANNTDINSVNIAEGCAPSGINNAIRELMADLKNALFAKINVTADTSAGDDAAIGYTAAEGLILTGQGSTNDVTIKNDADAIVIKIPTGTTNADVIGALTATSYGGITEANLLDKTATEAVTGQYTFTAPILGTPASGVATNLTGTAAGLTSGNVTIADESSDTTCFPLFTTAATGGLPPKSGSNLTFNSSTGILGATTFSGAGTSLTGTGASFTAGTVTTNANLTGPITSSGNATSVAAQTGSGSVFVMNTSPALVTPALGTPASGVATNITGLPAASVVAGSLGAGAYTITNSSSGALTTGLLLTNATATSANTAVAFYLSPNAAGTARAASIVSEQTTSGNYADLTLNVSNGDTPFEGMSIATTGNVTIPAGNLTVSNLFANTQVSIADDAYVAITPPRNGGWCFMTYGGDSATPANIHSALFYYDVGSSLLGTIETTGISTSVTIAAAARTGTDGTDGKVNIGIQSGVIQIESRTGYTKNYQITFV